jgi:prolyl-tRNA synthetase
MSEEKVTPRSENYSEWYIDVIKKAELVDYGGDLARGTMVIRPYAYALWENIQGALDRRFKATGHKNAYFPLFIPYSFIQKEADHVEGFAPELALVTYGGGKELEEPLVVRPTSETIINYMFARWVQSYRDLPLLINQWANVVRWEMRTRPFLRTLEFLWQEGHTAHATPEEAEEEALRMLNIYVDFAENEAAVPVIAGRKSKLETFAGADHSYTIEAMMGDGKALQSGTSHNLGQHFSKAFNIQFQDEKGDLQHAWQTSWGLSTRFVGAIIMVHGDDQGLILPPRLAPVQVVIVPIWRNENEKAAVFGAVERTAFMLREAGVRVETDLREQQTPGWKFNEWEMKGVPLRIEIGPRDVEKQAVVFARRDIPGKPGKTFDIPIASVGERAQDMLEIIQQSLFERAKRFLSDNTVEAADYNAFKSAIEDAKFVRAWWAGSDADEAKIKEETGATIRCFPLAQPTGSGPCFYTGTQAQRVAIFARAY